MNLVELSTERSELFLRALLELDEAGARALHGAQQLIELQIDGFAIAVLGVLDDEDHEERDDRRSGVDDELPRVGVAVAGPERRPRDDDQDRGQERPGRSKGVPRSFGEPRHGGLGFVGQPCDQSGRLLAPRQPGSLPRPQ